MLYDDGDYSCDSILIVEVHWEELVVIGRWWWMMVDDGGGDGGDEDENVYDVGYSCDSILIVEVHWEELMVQPSSINCFLDRLQTKTIKELSKK